MVRRHLVGTLRNRSGARLQVDNELDSPSRGYSRKFFWENILEFTNDWDVLDALKWSSVQRIQGINLSLSVLGEVSLIIHYLIRRVQEVYHFSGTIDRGIVSLQQIHSQNKIDFGRAQNNWKCLKLQHLNF